MWQGCLTRGRILEFYVGYFWGYFSIFRATWKQNFLYLTLTVEKQLATNVSDGQTDRQTKVSV